jgi:predicted enzyme related to lactoylglutathione lyase/DNA gyrase inhibitor GyrI
MSATTETTPNQLNVRVEKLEPMRVARFHARDHHPEALAWTRLREWAEPQGLLKDPAAHPIFGFNNPGPSAPSDEYGYEVWIRIDVEMAVAGGVEALEFPGGWYAALTHAGLPNPEVWMQLLNWVRCSPHAHRHAHELEHPRNPLAPESERVFDLYLPINPAISASAAVGMKVRGTDFVMYPVSNLEHAARFYRETLGLPQEMFSEQWQWAEFDCGNVTLALKGGETAPERVTGGRIALAVEDVRAACAAVRSRGGRIQTEPVDYGVCCAAEVLDPDGNVVILHRRADGTWGQPS